MGISVIFAATARNSTHFLKLVFVRKSSSNSREDASHCAKSLGMPKCKIE